MNRTINISLVLFISLFTCYQALSQINNNSNTFIGQWVSEQSSVRMVIFKDKDDAFQVRAWDSDDDEELHISNIQVQGDTLKTTEIIKSTGWVTYNTFIIVDINTLKNIIDGDANGRTILYERVK